MDYPGEKLLERMWESLVDKGIGGLLRPWQTRREGRAQIGVQAEAIRVLAQAERDAEEIRSGRRVLRGPDLLCLPNGTASPHTPAPSERIEPNFGPLELVQEVERTQIADAARREVNVAKAIVRAEEELQNDEQEPPDEKVDADWLYRWRDAAGTVSSEELQALWGRLLAGEVKAPGTFSLRTLDFLRNLSRADADAITRLSRFVVQDVVVRVADVLDHEGITFGFLLDMQDLGVLAGVETVKLEVSWGTQTSDRFARALVSHRRVLVATADDASKKLKVQAVKLTAIGREIIRLGSFEAHDAYLRAVADKIKSQGFAVQLATLDQIDDDSISFSHAEDL